MADRKQVKNRLRAKLQQRKKEEMEADKKSEMMENYPTTQGNVATTGDADPTKGDMHPVCLKLGYDPDGNPTSATLELDDGVQMTVHNNGKIGKAAMKQILETIKGKQVPGGFLNAEAPGDLAKRLYDSIPRRSKSEPSLEEKVAAIKAKMAERREGELGEKSGSSELKKFPVASDEDLNSSSVSLPQPTAELIQKALKKKVSSSMDVPISCDNVISSEINYDAEVMDLLQKKTEEEQERAAKEKAKEEFLKCSVRNGKYPSTLQEHYDFVKKTFEYLKATGVVKKAE